MCCDLRTQGRLTYTAPEFQGLAHLEFIFVQGTCMDPQGTLSMPEAVGRNSLPKSCYWYTSCSVLHTLWRGAKPENPVISHCAESLCPIFGRFHSVGAQVEVPPRSIGKKGSPKRLPLEPSRQSPVEEKEIIKFSLQSLYQTFSAGGIRGDVLIDIGSGPTIYQLLSACEVFREIIVTDYTPQNLQELQKWLKKEPGAYDWSSIVQHVCELEGDRSKWQEKEAKLRRTVTRVLRCDVTKSPALGSAQVPLADCVLTFLAMECACLDVDTYRAALRRLADLLKPGGHLVTLVTLGFQNYMVGPKKFSGVYLERETVEKAVQDAGCQVLKCNCTPLRYSQAFCKGLCFIVARKSSNA